MKLKINKNTVRKWVRVLLCLAAAGILFVAVSNLWMVSAGKKKMVSDAEMRSLGADCLLILGAGIWENNQPSPMLRDRLDEGIRLYEAGAAPKILVSGDHGRSDYDEVNVMKKYLTDAGIPAEDVFMDHAGFSTYESVYRAKEIFGVEKMIVVTQEYHLYRALYICGQLGVAAYGAPSDPRSYRGALYRNARECLARDKDIVYCLFRIPPTYLGESIDIHGDGNVTND